jgi:hypothetical protein
VSPPDGVGVAGVVVPPPLGADGVAAPPLASPLASVSVESVSSVESVESELFSSDDEVLPPGGGSGSVAGELDWSEGVSSPPPFGMIATITINTKIVATIATIRRRQ